MIGQLLLEEKSVGSRVTLIPEILIPTIDGMLHTVFPVVDPAHSVTVCCTDCPTLIEPKFKDVGDTVNVPGDAATLRQAIPVAAREKGRALAGHQSAATTGREAGVTDTME